MNSGEETAYDNHLADTATETYDRELDYTLEENSEHVLAEIDAALRRIDVPGLADATGPGSPILRQGSAPGRVSLGQRIQPSAIPERANETWTRMEVESYLKIWRLRNPGAYVEFVA